MENSTQKTTTTQKLDESMPTNYMLWLVVIAALIIFTGLGLINLAFQKKQAEVMSKSSAKLQAVTPQPTLPPQMGNIMLSSASNKTKMGQTSTFTVKADSEGKGVVGFDILITYDPSKLSVNKVTSLDADFQISSFTKRKGVISITGTKTSAGQVSEVLTKTDLISVSVTSLQSGMTIVDIKPSIKNERTRLVDKNFQQYTPKSGSLQLEIL